MCHKPVGYLFMAEVGVNCKPVDQQMFTIFIKFAVLFVEVIGDIGLVRTAAVDKTDYLSRCLSLEKPLGEVSQTVLKGFSRCCLIGRKRKTFDIVKLIKVGKLRLFYNDIR